MRTISRLDINNEEQKLLTELSNGINEMIRHFPGYQNEILLQAEDKRTTIIRFANILRRLTEEGIND